jgi:hypothetical protein
MCLATPPGILPATVVPVPAHQHGTAGNQHNPCHVGCRHTRAHKLTFCVLPLNHPYVPLPPTITQAEAAKASEDEGEEELYVEDRLGDAEDADEDEQQQPGSSDEEGDGPGAAGPGPGSMALQQQQQKKGEIVPLG